MTILHIPRDCQLPLSHYESCHLCGDKILASVLSVFAFAKNITCPFGWSSAWRVETIHAQMSPWSGLYSEFISGEWSHIQNLYTHNIHHQNNITNQSENWVFIQWLQKSNVWISLHCIKNNFVPYILTKHIKSTLQYF